jgi:hypothetical protein
MSGNNHKNRNFLLAYAVLVALPLVGLAGILRNGHKLTAPVSVDGVWKLQIDAAKLAALPCGKALVATENTAFTISQSGQRFTLSLANAPKAAASGVIEGSALTASIVPSSAWASEADCGNDRVLKLVATVDPKAEPRTVVGMLSVTDCPSCTPVELRAFRERQAGESRGH